MKLVERYFWVVCLAAIGLGLFLPWTGRVVAGQLRLVLGSILFFTALKLDWLAAWHEVRRPGLILYAAFLMMLVLPLAVYALVRQTLPPVLALGVLVVAAMPAGSACSSLSDIVGGNPALALVGTLTTCLVCPLTVPFVLGVACQQPLAGSVAQMSRQAGFLMLTIFVPLALGAVVRQVFPAFVQRHREAFTGCSILALGVLVLGAMSLMSADFLAMSRQQPAMVLRLFICMCLFSLTMHVAGYWLAPWRPLPDRAALSINTAYVNNGLAIVFATAFLKPLPEYGALVVLPAILVELPMDMAIVPLRKWISRRRKSEPFGHQ
jgi:BASS family bile acid:Na+ symporter